MQPTGDYLLHIALTATRAIANKTKMQNVSDHFDGRGGAPVLSRALPDGGGPWLSYKPLYVAIGGALALIGIN